MARRTAAARAREEQRAVEAEAEAEAAALRAWAAATAGEPQRLEADGQEATRVYTVVLAGCNMQSRGGCHGMAQGHPGNQNDKNGVPGAFTSLRQLQFGLSLQRLDLSQNDLDELPVGIHSWLGGLQALDVTRNKFIRRPMVAPPPRSIEKGARLLLPWCREEEAERAETAERERAEAEAEAEAEEARRRMLEMQLLRQAQEQAEEEKRMRLEKVVLVALHTCYCPHCLYDGLLVGCVLDARASTSSPVAVRLHWC
jgi:hypothetical protein